MTTTNSYAHIAERLFIGLLGVSITTATPLINWIESNVQWTATSPQITQAGAGLILVLSWLAALYIAAREP